MANTYGPIQDYLTQNATQIHPMITQVINDQPTAWDALGNTEFWTDEMSAKQKTWQFDRPMLAGGNDPVDWADMHADPVENDLHANHLAEVAAGFIPPADDAIFGQTLREYNLQAKAVWGPNLDVEQLRNKMKRAEQIQKSVNALANLIHEYRIERKRNEYYRICQAKVVCDGSFNFATDLFNNTSFPYPDGTDDSYSMLTMPFIHMGYEHLGLQGAAQGALGHVQGRPVYAMITSARQSTRVATYDADIREDFRVNDIKSHLLAPMGVKFSYAGFTFLSDDRVKRWNYRTFGAGMTETTTHLVSITPQTDTKYAEIVINTKPAAGRFYPGTQLTPDNTFTASNRFPMEIIKSTDTDPNTGLKYLVRFCDRTKVFAATDTGKSGTFPAWVAVPQFIYTTTHATPNAIKRIPNSAYLTAKWEDSVVYHEGVSTTMVPKPIGAVGQANFQPRDFHGKIDFKVYPDKGTNPDGTFGNFRAILANGTRPDRPELGVIYRHLACPLPHGMFLDLEDDPSA